MSNATWNGTTIAEGEDIEVVEGNVYFAQTDVRSELLLPSDKTTSCFWKGTAHYHHVVVDGEVNENAAWYYPEPMSTAESIRDRIAFWRGVHVER